MNASLRALLSGVIDYAGLFPPAKLPLDQAIRNYARYRQGPDAWMLGRFVIPAARLAELEALADIWSDDRPLHIAILGRGGGDQNAYVDGLVKDYADVTRFTAAHAGRVVADVYEARLPACDRIGFLAHFTAETSGRGRWMLFLEAELDVGADEPLAVALARMAARFKWTVESKSPDQRLYARTGYKLRCGGLEASAFPTVDQVASVLAASRDAGVPLKLTAGLHHPIRRFDAGVQTHMHGFINVFTAGVLAHARRFDEETLRDVIADEDPAHFAFTDAGLSWKDCRATTEEIAAARRDFVTSSGSCSFDEPRDDLRALGWM